MDPYGYDKFGKLEPVQATTSISRLISSLPIVSLLQLYLLYQSSLGHAYGHFWDQHYQHHYI